MPIINTETTTHDAISQRGNGSYTVPFILITSLFFLWGIANSLNGTLIKHFQTALTLNRAQAGIIDSAFYIGYFVMALPAGFIMNKLGYKKGILIGLGLYAAGALLFYPAAEVRAYGFFLFALFVIACGLAFLETAANPYVTILGKPSTADVRINLAQSFNGLSIVFGPIIGSLFIFSAAEHTNESLAIMAPDQAEAIRIAEAHSVQMPYLVIAGIVILVMILFAITKMPEITTSSERASFKGIFRHTHLVFGIMAIFFYCGAQTSLWGYFVDLKLHYAYAEHLGIVNWIYRITENMTPTQIASYHASFALVLFMIGRMVGTALLTKFRANSLLAFYAAACMILIIYALLTTGLHAIVAIALTYFFMSIMFPTIFSLGIKNLGPQMKLGAALMVMGIVGGAVLPPLAGWMSLSGMEKALYLPFASFAVILIFGLYGYKVKDTTAVN